MYTIDCPPTRPDKLLDVVSKHCLLLDQFLTHKPLARHTSDAFEKVVAMVPPNATLILDSGCGTGRSTQHLASMLPSEDYWVLGIDQSLVRLERNSCFRSQRHQQQQDDPQPYDNNEYVWKMDSEEENQDKKLTLRKPSALWIRAELVDFWRLLLQHQQQTNWKIHSHYLLYPNPYPKPKRLTSRWYGHPSFPLIMQLGGERIVLRSNWKTYLEEFAQAVILADKVWTDAGNADNAAKPYAHAARRGPIQREISLGQEGWSNFEIKMDKAGEPTYELVLTRLKAHY